MFRAVDVQPGRRMFDFLLEIVMMLVIFDTLP